LASLDVGAPLGPVSVELVALDVKRAFVSCSAFELTCVENVAAPTKR
jgi:hypothetical protein